MLTRTPRAVTGAIRELAERLVPGAEPAYVEIKPRSDGTVNECFAAVDQQVSDYGGKIHYGWSMWEWPGVMIEAEFHAVWKRPDGSLQCVTPRADEERRILFLSDPERVWAGRYIDNVRVPLNEDPKVKEFVRLAEKKCEVLNRGQRASVFGPIAIPADEIEPIMFQMAQLQREISDPMTRPLSRNGPCPCGRGKIYKRCHGRRV